MSVSLKDMRAFAEAYPKKQFVQQAVAQLPWSHNIRILELVKSSQQRDTHKPMGVAQYKLTGALPERLKSELPTNEDLAPELPLMNLVSLRSRLEKTLAKIAKARQMRWEQREIEVLLGKLADQKALSSHIVKDLRAVAGFLNSAVHGKTISKADAKKALKLGESVLARLEEASG
jgi:hypothetical protein